ncbi:MAG: hypothetical protein HY762_00300, partial [Planctomycetes bacterium]|nr:hypothetical protein [Planctomycetota bacterium]
MKKVALIVGLLVITLALNLEAGVSTEKNAWNAKDISISGGFDNTMLYRDQGLNSVLDGMQTPNKQKSDFIWTPLVTLNLGADVGDKILAFVQLQNRRLDNTALGTAANVDFLGGDNTELAVEQAYIKIEKLISDDLTLTYGAQNLKFTLRKDEGGFFLDVLKSENLAAPITEANGYRGFPLPKNTTEFAGFKFDYGSLSKANYDATLFWGIASETGVAHADEKLMGLAARYKLPGGKDERDVLHGSYTIIAQNAARLNIHTIGLGVEYFSSMPNLELYGEYYTQSGDLDANVALDASAYRIGAKYDFKQKMAPYVDVSYWFLSGGGDATTSNNFYSYENVQSSLILEDNVFGLDLDSN